MGSVTPATGMMLIVQIALPKLSTLCMHSSRPARPGEAEEDEVVMQSSLNAAVTGLFLLKFSTCWKEIS